MNFVGFFFFFCMDNWFACFFFFFFFFFPHQGKKQTCKGCHFQRFKKKEKFLGYYLSWVELHLSKNFHSNGTKLWEELQNRHTGHKYALKYDNLQLRNNQYLDHILPSTSKHTIVFLQITALTLALYTRIFSTVVPCTCILSRKTKYFYP